MSLEIHRDNKTHTSYGFTLRRTKLNKDVTKELYFDHLIRIFSLFCSFSDLVFESTSGLHCHGIVKIPNNIAMHRFRVRGWNLRLVELYDREQWLCYLNKDQDDPTPDMVSCDDGFIMPSKKLFPKPNV